jgi:hypothetical protein
MTKTELGAAEALAILEQQQRSVSTQMSSFVPGMTAVWGGAWLLGFGALFAQAVSGFPLWIAVTVFVALLVAAGLLSMVLGIRSNRGIRATRQSAFSGTVYGVTWSFGSVALAAIGGGLAHNGMSGELASHFYPTIFLFFIGIMYILAGAVWPNVYTVVTGGVLVVVAVAALFIAAPFHLLFLALAAGGSFFVLAIVHGLAQKRATRG